MLLFEFSSFILTQKYKRFKQSKEESHQEKKERGISRLAQKIENFQKQNRRWQCTSIILKQPGEEASLTSSGLQTRFPCCRVSQRLASMVFARRRSEWLGVRAGREKAMSGPLWRLERIILCHQLLGCVAVKMMCSSSFFLLPKSISEGWLLLHGPTPSRPS